MIRCSTEIRVRYAETDQMGFAYHGAYLPWLEIGRTQLLREYGLPYRDLEQQGFFLPVIDARLSYKRPARYDDVLQVVTRMSDRPVLRIELHYEVRRGEDLLASATTTHAFIDREGRPVRPPPAFTERMRELFPEDGAATSAVR